MIIIGKDYITDTSLGPVYIYKSFDSTHKPELGQKCGQLLLCLKKGTKEEVEGALKKVENGILESKEILYL